jgi:tartrate dehydratase alpha subunit/fumarate hydratase class I-like protein
MKAKDKQRQFLIELMNTDHDSGLYDLSREDVEQIIRTCGNPKKIKSMDKREIKKCVYKILDAFCNRTGFDDWWYDLGEEIEQEIIEELEGIISKRINKSTENKYLKSEEAQELFQKIVERDTWEKGLPKIYMDKKGNIVEHWKDGTINIIKTKDMTREHAKDELIEVLMNQVADLTMMSKIELGDDVITEINQLKKIING